MNSFEQWMKAVDRIISARLGGLDSQDLPDQCYADWYNDGVSAARAARKAIRESRG